MERRNNSTEVADLLFAVRRKGVRVWAKDGELRYQAPHGALTEVEYTRLREKREEIITFLRPPSSSSLTDSQLIPRLPSEIVPLTFSQQVIWNSLDHGRHRRRLAQLPVRLMGRWNIEYLKLSLAELVLHHESLRTRIVKVNEVPRQAIDATTEFQLKIVQLTGTSEAGPDASVRRVITDLANERIDVSVGPLFAATLIRFDDEYQVLVISWDHFFFDAVSIRAFWRQLWALYEQCLRFQRCSLPSESVQFADYAVWQRKNDPSWMSQHGNYWGEHLAGVKHVLLFKNEEILNGARSALRHSSIRFDRMTVESLLNLGRREKTTLGIILLSAYFATVLGWCNSKEAVLSFVTAGRSNPEVENTIGFFSSMSYLRVNLSADDRFIDLIVQVTKELSSAYKHEDSCRTLTRLPLPEFALNTSFNWFPREVSMDPTAHFDAHSISKLGGTVALQALEIDWALDNREDSDDDGGMEPRLTLYENDEGVRGDMYFRDSRVAPTTVERFLGNFKLMTEALLGDPNARVMSIDLER